MALAQVESLAAVSRDDWDRLLGEDGFYCSHGWLKAHELDSSAEVVYLLVRHGERIVGGLPLYRVKHELNEAYDEARRRLGLDGPCLVAGSRRGYGNVLPVDPALSPDDRLRVVRQLVGAAQEVARDSGATGVFWPFARTETVGTLAAVAHTVASIDAAGASLETGGMDLEAYLASLRSGRRQEARRDIRKFARAGWRLTEERLERCYREGAPLLANVERKYGHRVTERGLERYLHRQLEALGDRDVVFACRDADGALAAYALLYRWRRVLQGRMVGFDYARLRGASEYFILVFWGPVEYAGRHGIWRIDLGVGALTAKVLRGARLYPLWSTFLDTRRRPPGLELSRPDAALEWQRRFAAYPGALDPREWDAPVVPPEPSS